MAVRYKTWTNTADGSREKVSVAHWRVLKQARKNGVDIYVTDGHRTMAEQSFLRRLWEAGKGALAAIPSPWAPHIRVGRADHALDLGRSPAEVQKAIRYLNSRGLRARLTVPGEWWHVEVDPSRLRSLSRRILRRWRRRRR